jgi:hypothetical protein
MDPEVMGCKRRMRGVRLIAGMAVEALAADRTIE